jgi:hypothetical protein
VTEPSFLHATWAAHDTIAADYAERFRAGLDTRASRARIVREPDEDETLPRAYLRARSG